MKKIRFLLALILAFSTSGVMFAQEQEVITLDPENESSFYETVLDEEENDDDPVIKIDDASIYHQNDTNGTFVHNALTNDSAAAPDYARPRFNLFSTLAETAQQVYNLEIERTDIPSALLKDQLTWHYEKGPLESLHIWSAYQMHYDTTIPERGETGSKFDMCLINVLIDGKFKDGKENFRIMLDPTHRHSHIPFMEPFIQDLYIESHRLAHTSILVGNSRPGVGIEGAQSPYTLAFINRSQISRNLANIRKFGLRVRGDYSLMDYDVGVYSSSTNFTSFFPGHECDAWINIKPLGKTDGKWGKLVTGAGLQSGSKHDVSYNLTSAYAGYDYKRFWTKFEYAYANGSNGGAGLTRNRSQGMFVTVGYHLTKKLEILARYDQFDPDRYKTANNLREYTLGSNYYLKGQALKLIFNYVYCQNDNKVDSHRLMVGTQVVL